MIVEIVPIPDREFDAGSTKLKKYPILKKIHIATSPEFNKIRLIINNKMDEYIKENNIKDAEIAQ